MRAGPRRHPTWLSRRGAAVTGALALPVLVSGCGFVNALAHPAAPPTSSEATATAAGPSADPVLVAAADLVASSKARPASLAAAVSPPLSGVPPLQAQGGTLADDCHLSPDATEYETLTVGFTDRGPADTKEDDESPNLRVDVVAPAGSGLGVFVKDSHETYCQGSATMPTQTTLQTEDLADAHQAFTVYVVARTGPSTPDPLHGVTLQLRDMRREPDVINAHTWTWQVQRVTTGSACPGEPDALCVPLP